MIKRALLLILTVYKKAVSPALPPSCRFYPGCADYAHGAIKTHGAARGTLFAAKRLLKCHPYHPGGFDPVPAQRTPDKQQAPDLKDFATQAEHGSGRSA